MNMQPPLICFLHSEFFPRFIQLLKFIPLEYFENITSIIFYIDLKFSHLTKAS